MKSTTRSLQGLSLIELLVVIGATIVVGTIGLFYYRDYGRRQIVSQGVESLHTEIVQIRQRALSGQFSVDCPPGPPAYSLSAYIVGYNKNGGQNFTLSQLCSTPPNTTATEPVSTTSLPSGVTFDSGSTCPSTISFFTLGQGTNITTASCTLKLTGFGISSTVTIDNSGNVE